MALNRRIQHIRGTTAQNNVFTGRSGELTIDTDTNEVRVHDGSTVGGHRLYTKAEVDTLLSSKVTQTDINTSIAALLSAVYPVSSLYFGTQTTCPIAVLIPGSVWTLVSSGRALWTGNGTNANTTIAAGLPNITGKLGRIASSNNSVSGAFYNNGENERHGDSGSGLQYYGYTFDASRSSSVYRNDVTTVQPPAYVVNVWRRTA